MNNTEKLLSEELILICFYIHYFYLLFTITELTIIFSYLLFPDYQNIELNEMIFDGIFFN